MKTSKIFSPFVLLLIFFSAIAILLIVFLPKKQEPISDQTFCLNTSIAITIYHCEKDNATTLIEQCFSMCYEYEAIFSPTLKSSELYKLNHANNRSSISVSNDFYQLTKSALSYSQLTDGLFDPSIRPIMDLWDFSSKKVIPSIEAITETLPLVDFKKIELLADNTLTIPDLMMLDFGAISKGYIADRLAIFLQSNGVTSAIIDLGGNILCIGQKAKNTPFHIGIKNPQSPSESIVSLLINHYSVVTSGIYERSFISDEVLYHHLINPKTGFPFDHSLASVTILAHSSETADALSTSCFSVGLEKGLSLIDSFDDCYGIFITKDGTIHYSKGAKAFVAP